MFSHVDENTSMILGMPFGRIDGMSSNHGCVTVEACHTGKNGLIGFR